MTGFLGNPMGTSTEMMVDLSNTVWYLSLNGIMRVNDENEYDSLKINIQIKSLHFQAN